MKDKTNSISPVSFATPEPKPEEFPRYLLYFFRNKDVIIRHLCDYMHPLYEDTIHSEMLNVYIQRFFDEAYGRTFYIEDTKTGKRDEICSIANWYCHKATEL